MQAGRCLLTCAFTCALKYLPACALTCLCAAQPGSTTCCRLWQWTHLDCTPHNGGKLASMEQRGGCQGRQAAFHKYWHRTLRSTGGAFEHPFCPPPGKILSTRTCVAYFLGGGGEYGSTGVVADHARVCGPSNCVKPRH